MKLRRSRAAWPRRKASRWRDGARQALEAHTQAIGVLPARDRSEEAGAARRARLDRIVREIAALPILDPRTSQEIMDDLNVDSSALFAILFNEPERQAFEAVLTSGEPCAISAVNAHETASVLRGRLGPVLRTTDMRQAAHWFR
jgi:hypothetical protein